MNKRRQNVHNSNLRHGRTFNTNVNTVHRNTNEETGNITSKANISTLQQNHQHQTLLQINIYDNNNNKTQHQLRHHQHHKQQQYQQEQQQQHRHHNNRDVRETDPDEAAAVEEETAIYESLPQPLKQRMVFDESDYDDDDDDDDYDNTEQQNPPPLNMDVINVDRNFNIDMEQPIKVLTLGGSNEAATNKEGSGVFTTDDEDAASDEYDGSYAAARTNNNRLSAIKIISTPLGQFEGVAEGSVKKTTQSFTDFDALAPVSESSNRKTASSNSKIMPVLTPDGKVALLYREDEDTTIKSEQVNKTQPFRKDNNKKHEGQGFDMHEDSAVIAAIDDDYDYDGDEDEDEAEIENEDDVLSASNRHNLNDAAADQQKDAGSVDEARVAAAQANHINNNNNNNSNKNSNGSTILMRPTDSILPMINRPLSEVLGIKKNQFKQFRIKDDATSTTTTTTTLSRISSSIYSSTTSTTPHPQSMHALATGIEVLPHDIPIEQMPPPQTGLHEFDFSRDSTMLDERSRELLQHKGQVHNSQHNEVALNKGDLIDMEILPHLEQELRRAQQQEKRRHYHTRRNKHKPRTAEELSSIHCVMQIMMGIAAISTVFGMLGTFFKQRILDQLRLLH